MTIENMSALQIAELRTLKTIDYNDYMELMCDQSDELKALTDKGLSFNWGSSHISSFLSMKRDVYSWFESALSEEQKNRVLVYINSLVSKKLLTV